MRLRGGGRGEGGREGWGMGGRSSYIWALVDGCKAGAQLTAFRPNLLRFDLSCTPLSVNCTW